MPMARYPAKSVIASDDVEAVQHMAPEIRDGSITLDDIEVVAAKDFQTQAEVAKFMEDKLTVEVEADDDPNAPVFVYFGHNGVTQYIKRGEPQVVKRKFLYSAIAAKTVKFACAFGKDGSGNEYNRMTPSVKTTHRIRLIEDRNPQGGMKWFQKMAQEA